MVRWDKKKEGKILASLFENGLADPTKTKAADIDPVKEMREEFERFSKETFRANYKSTGTSFMAGKSVEGVRLSTLKQNLEDKQKDTTTDHTEEPEEFEEEEDDDEEIFAEQQPSTPIETKMPARSSIVKPISHMGGTYKYKEDEKKWDPIFKSSKFISNGYHREELIVEPPASFDGSDGTYQVSFENNNTVLVLKIAPNFALSDPHDINGYYRQKYGIVTAADSARSQAFKASGQGLADKWYTFRHQLDWPGKPSDDLEGMMPWLDFADIDSQGRLFPLLIINLCSIKPIEEQQRKVTGGLRRNKFVSPPKVKGVNMSADPTAQMAAMLENMIKNGTLSDEMKKTVRKFGMGERDKDDMNDDTDPMGSNKRANNNPFDDQTAFTNPAGVSLSGGTAAGVYWEN